MAPMNLHSIEALFFSKRLPFCAFPQYPPSATV